MQNLAEVWTHLNIKEVHTHLLVMLVCKIIQI